MLPCDPGMKGCVLYGRFVFANEEKNRRPQQKKARRGESVPSREASPERDDEA